MSDRFFHETPLQLGPAKLNGSEAHHLNHVLRAKPGLEVILFDGSGAEFAARVEQVERAAVRLAVYERARKTASRRRVSHLASHCRRVIATVAGRKMHRVRRGRVDSAGNRSRRGTARAGALENCGAVIEASKQCGRNRLMEIREPQAWD